MDYKKKSLNKLNRKESYEEIDTRLASGWYVDAGEKRNKKKYKTEKVSFKISKKIWIKFLISVDINIKNFKNRLIRQKTGCIS